MELFGCSRMRVLAGAALPVGDEECSGEENG